LRGRPRGVGGAAAAATPAHRAAQASALAMAFAARREVLYYGRLVCILLDNTITASPSE
jgi:hypothetical protein